MIAKETTKNRTFTLEVSEEELKILHSLVGACSCYDLSPDRLYDATLSARLGGMWKSMASMIGEEETYALSINKA